MKAGNTKSPAKAKNTEKNIGMKDLVLNALRGAIIATIFTIAVILIFALILKNGGVAESSIPLINQIIKILGVCIAALFVVLKGQEKFWICGGMSGVMYIVLGYLVFSLIEGAFGAPLVLLSDALMALIVGAVFSIIFSQFKRKK